MSKIHEVLKEYWGYDSFRPGQRTIIESVLDKRDTLALLPTGGGKSICYQVPGLTLSGVTLVISPLIALMHDQVQALKSRGISAVALTSDMSYREIDTALDNIVVGKYKFVYASPERLKTELFQARIDRMKVSLIAVDEAHCISQWGYDFRPVYLEIAEVRKYCPSVPVLALTATATPKVADDICVKLEFGGKPNIVKGDFKRENLSYFVEYTEKKNERLVQILKKNPGSSVVYLRTRRKCRETAEFLRKKGFKADYYHAGLLPEQRRNIQKQWLENRIDIICSTNAFGMGIDKPDVRTVIHPDLCDDPESYFQEAGRAGRDGKKAFAVTLFHESDLFELDRRFALSFPPFDEIKRVYKALGNYFQLAEGAGAGRTFEINIEKFCKNFNFNALTVFNALNILERDGYLEFSKDVSSSSRMKFLTDNKYLYEFKLKNKSLAPLIDVVLRSYDGGFEEYINVFETKLAGKLNTTYFEVVKGFEYLDKVGVLHYIPQTNNPRVTYLRDRVSNSQFALEPESYELLKKRALNRKRAITDFVKRDDTCRSRLLLKYFGQDDTEDCEICDVCVRRKKERARSERLRQYVTDHEGCDIDRLKESLPFYTEESIVETLRRLSEEREVEEREGRFYRVVK